MTTDLRSKASKEIIRKVKERQSKGLPCKVVSTTMYEVWWILDFDVLRRALALLEAINIHVRHEDVTGVEIRKLKSNSFEPKVEGSLYPPDRWYQNALSCKRDSSRESMILMIPNVASLIMILFGDMQKIKWL